MASRRGRLTSVTERIREIGLRKALGATRSDLTSQFLAESVALTVIGGMHASTCRPPCRRGLQRVGVARVRAILGGETGPRRDVVLMNAAAALLAAGKADDLASGVALARDSIDSGRAQAALDALGAVSRRLAAAASRRVPETEATL